MHSNGSILLRESRISQAGNRGLGSARQVANEPARWQHLTANLCGQSASRPGVMAGAQDVLLGALVKAVGVSTCRSGDAPLSLRKISMGAGTKIVALWAPH
jgi:hypothetical protein